MSNVECSIACERRDSGTELLLEGGTTIGVNCAVAEQVRVPTTPNPAFEDDDGDGIRNINDPDSEHYKYFDNCSNPWMDCDGDGLPNFLDDEWEFFFFRGGCNQPQEYVPGTQPGPANNPLGNTWDKCHALSDPDGDGVVNHLDHDDDWDGIPDDIDDDPYMPCWLTNTCPAGSPPAPPHPPIPPGPPGGGGGGGGGGGNPNECELRIWKYTKYVDAQLPMMVSAIRLDGETCEEYEWTGGGAAMMGGGGGQGFPPCDGDITGGFGERDGVVDISDLTEVILRWGACPAPPGECAGDIAPAGGDGVVDINDLTAVILNWGACDYDGDGMPDGWKMDWGTNPYAADGIGDLDGDGLSNVQEFNHGTDPVEVDSDGDGVSDGAEVIGGSDPTDSSDGGVGQNSENVAYVILTFGDQSCHNSELWAMWFNDVRYIRAEAVTEGCVEPPNMPQFCGAPWSCPERAPHDVGPIAIERGRSYPIRMEWVDSAYLTYGPDYDWTCKVEVCDENGGNRQALLQFQANGPGYLDDDWVPTAPVNGFYIVDGGNLMGARWIPEGPVGDYEAEAMLMPVTLNLVAPVADSLEDDPGLETIVFDPPMDHDQYPPLNLVIAPPGMSATVRLEAIEGAEHIKLWRLVSQIGGAEIWQAISFPIDVPTDDLESGAFHRPLYIEPLTPGICRLKASIANGATVIQDSVRIDVSPRAKVLIVTTIQADSDWPGPRPTGMEARLGYAAGVTPSDDQLIFDVVMTIPGGFANAMIPSIQSFANLFGATFNVPTVSLAQATTADKQWITLAMLKRSGNPEPPQAYSGAPSPDLPVEQQKWRLLNEFVAAGLVDSDGTFGPSLSLPVQRHEIGPTPITFQGTATFSTSGGATVSATVGGNFTLGGNTADTADQNGLVTGGSDSDTEISHRCAGRIGPLLEPYEHALIPKRAAPFFSLAIVRVRGTGISFEGDADGSQNSALRWPTAHVYMWNFTTRQYELVEEFTQAENPFAWIDQYGTAWPP